jgi:regulator of replication initiation timing
LAEHQAQAAAANARADTLASEVQNVRAQIDREVADRRTLQGQADTLRDELAHARLDAARATGAATTEQARREAAEAKAADLQRQVEALEARRRRWWRF